MAGIGSTPISTTAIAAGDTSPGAPSPTSTILACTTKSTFSGADQSHFPTGIVAIDPRTGTQTLVSEGGLFQLPTYIAAGPKGTIYVSDLHANAIILVDLATGKQLIAAEGGLLDGPNGLLYSAPHHALIVACLGDSSGKVHRLVGLDLKTGGQTIITETPSGFSVPVGICWSTPFGPDPSLPAQCYVGDEPGNVQGASLGGLWKVTLSTGMQTLIAYGDHFDHPSDIALEKNGNILIGNTGNEANGYTGSVSRINPKTGVKELLTRFGLSSGLDSLDVGPDGTIYVACMSTTSDDARIYAVDPLTGEQTVLARGGLLSMIEGIRVI